MKKEIMMLIARGGKVGDVQSLVETSVGEICAEYIRYIETNRDKTKNLQAWCEERLEK